MIDIALFPIPECVSFPGTIFPLHVFEPRYRTMVNHCLSNDMKMAVCHTQKEIHPARSNQEIEEALNSNQATYKPYPVFSAGRCELVETLEDGRMMINVHLEARYRAVQEVQLLPFSIYSCEVYADVPIIDNDLGKAEQLRQKIMKRLIAITATDSIAQRVLNSEMWLERSVTEFSFEIMGILQLDAENKQDVLESRSPLQRLEMIFELLRD